jgi:hypothetical protein
MSSPIHLHRHRWTIVGSLAPLLLLACPPVTALGKVPAAQSLRIGGVKIRSTAEGGCATV